MLKRVWKISLAVGVITFLSVAVGSAMNMGAAEMNMAGGDQGEVWFPHQQHQRTIGDCFQCHNLFPQEAGSIQKKIAEGTLKQKQVMNKQCIACHRKMKKAGQASGPVSCKKCHQKK